MHRDSVRLALAVALGAAVCAIVMLVARPVVQPPPILSSGDEPREGVSPALSVVANGGPQDEGVGGSDTAPQTSPKEPAGVELVVRVRVTDLAGRLLPEASAFIEWSEGGGERAGEDGWITLRHAPASGTRLSVMARAPNFRGKGVSVSHESAAEGIVIELVPDPPVEVRSAVTGELLVWKALVPGRRAHDVPITGLWSMIHHQAVVSAPGHLSLPVESLGARLSSQLLRAAEADRATLYLLPLRSLGAFTLTIDAPGANVAYGQLTTSGDSRQQQRALHGRFPAVWRKHYETHSVRRQIADIAGTVLASPTSGSPIDFRFDEALRAHVIPGDAPLDVVIWVPDHEVVRLTLQPDAAERLVHVRPVPQPWVAKPVEIRDRFASTRKAGVEALRVRMTRPFRCDLPAIGLGPNTLRLPPGSPSYQLSVWGGSRGSTGAQFGPDQLAEPLLLLLEGSAVAVQLIDRVTKQPIRRAEIHLNGQVGTFDASCACFRFDGVPPRVVGVTVRVLGPTGGVVRNVSKTVDVSTSTDAEPVTLEV